MKFKALSPIKHDGIYYKAGRELEIDIENRKMRVAVKELISSGVIEPVIENIEKSDQKDIK